MPLITLTSEWLPSDFYPGRLKGVISSLCPGVQIIDNAHSLVPFNLQQAAFVVRNTFESYPPGTIHLICVHTDSGKKTPVTVVMSKGHYFIGSDNGIFSLILNSPAEKVIHLNLAEGDDEIRLFAETACALASGKSIDEIGSGAEALVEKVPMRATIDNNVVTGSVIFIDSYGNAITNVTREIFQRIFENRRFQILVQSNKHRIDKISPGYSAEQVGDLLAQFNSLDLLEISINGGNAAQLFDLTPGSTIRIEGVKVSDPKEKLF